MEENKNQEEIDRQLEEIEAAYNKFQNLVKQARKQGNYLINQMHQKIEEVEVEKTLDKIKKEQ